MSQQNQNARGRQSPHDLDGRRQATQTAEDAQERTTIVDRRPGLDPEHIQWIREERGIDPDIAEQLGVYSVTLQFRNKRQAQAILFPTIVEGKEVSWGARFDMTGKPMKGFVSSPDARLNLAFADQVYEQDYLLCDNRAMKPMVDELPERIVVLCEGHPDAMAARMAGFVGISLPNGTRSTHWIETWAPKLANCRRVVLWLDDDDDGRKLLAHLLKELWGNIYIANPPKEVDGRPIKDANDLLRNLGVQAVKEAVLSAKSRMGGKYNIRPTRLYHPVTSFTTGLKFFDERMVLCAGEHTAIVGRTNRGKSKLANFWAYTAAKNNNEKVYFQSMESVADGELTADLAEFEMGMPIEDIIADGGLYREALNRIKDRVVALEPALAPRSTDPMGACCARMVEQACEGVRIFVIDNYSMFQSFGGKGVNENAQTRQDIIDVNEIARKYDIAPIICYHARKPPPQFMIKNLPPEIEDALGSGAIGNHCCLGVTVERVMEGSLDTNNVNLAVRKARRAIHGRRCDFHSWFDHTAQAYAFGGEGFTGIDTGFRKRNSKPSFMADSTPEKGSGQSLL